MTLFLLERRERLSVYGAACAAYAEECERYAIRNRFDNFNNLEGIGVETVSTGSAAVYSLTISPMVAAWISEAISMPPEA